MLRPRRSWRQVVVDNFWLIAFFVFLGFNFGQHMALERRIDRWEGEMGFSRATGWISAVASHFGSGDGLENAVMFSGTRVNSKTLFFASRHMPMGTKCLFFYPKTKKYAVGICLDWGPKAGLKPPRDIDLGPALAKQLQFVGLGSIKYKVL